MTSEKKETEKTVTKTKAALGASHLKIQQLFKLMVDNGASDLHLNVGAPPGMRVNGEIIKVLLPE